MVKNLNFIEIGPRDGFQSVKEFIPTDTKKKIIDMLVDSGLKTIQVTSFISPKAIPQMSDATEVAQYAISKYPDVKFYALTPNRKGIDNGYKAGLREVAYVISVSESHNKANVNATTEESFAELAQAIKDYPDMTISLDVATAFGCPFEGVTSLERLIDFVQRGIDIGVRTFDICDTIGVAYPKQVKEYMAALQNKFPEGNFGIHIHDTRNMGMLNTYVAIEVGVTRIFSVCGGLGGCPFAPGASGNTASEDLANMLTLCGYDLGVDVNKLIETAKYIKEVIPTGNFSSHHINIDGLQYCTV
ncbi:MAG: hydroxymethylglutaryl-CoA lyase [Filifactoraceae bacterium]